MIDRDGKVENDPNDVHNIIKTFYSNLYEDKAISEHSMNFFLSHITTKLNNTDKEFFERDLTTNELTKAMLSMQSNKSPGLDGLPKEFYNTFSEQLKDPLLQVFKESFHRGVLPPSLRAGSISLHFKKGDRKDLKNWRPLTLLGVDVKILSKALFFRMQPVVHQLIGIGQTCGVIDRTISDSLALVRDSYLFA